MDEIRRSQLQRWAIIQHYGICPTPLLDVTQSLRVATTFAAMGGESGTACVFVLGVPQYSGSISIDVANELQVLNLVAHSVPETRRPQLQEGYLLGDYPPLDAGSRLETYLDSEVDFDRRLVAKFQFDVSTFFSGVRGFGRIPKKHLLGGAGDEFEPVAAKVRADLDSELGASGL